MEINLLKLDRRSNSTVISQVLFRKGKPNNSFASQILISLYPSNSATYLLTPWCRVLLEKLTGLQLLKKFPTFHGTRKFITALTSVRHLSLSWAIPIQSINPHPTSWRSIQRYYREQFLSRLFVKRFLEYMEKKIMWQTRLSFVAQEFSTQDK